MKNLRDKFVYWTKRMVFRLDKWDEEMAEWLERHPFFSFAFDKICEIFWYGFKVYITLRIVFLILFDI